jgi:hypothetical protein
MTGRLPTRRFARDPHTLSRRTLDAVVVLPPGRGDPVTVSGAGPALWALLRDPCTLDELATSLQLSDREVASMTTALAQLSECGALLELPADQAEG